MGYSVEVMYSKEEVKDHFNELYRSNVLTSSCNKFMRRSLLMENNIRYSEKLFLMEDFLFSLDFIAICNHVYVMPDVIYRYKQSEDEGNVYRRMKRINNLTEFMIPFQNRLKDYPTVFFQVYFMLLQQKLWLANLAEIKVVAHNHMLSGFKPVTKNDKRLCNDLEAGHYIKIYLKNKRMQFRHRIANMVKQTRLYQRLKYR